MKRAVLAACTVLSLAGCADRGGLSSIHALNSNVSAVNTLMRTLRTTASGLTASCGYGQPCPRTLQPSLWRY